MRSLILIVLAACGDNRALPAVDAPTCADGPCVASCSVVLAGNIDETSSSPAECPVLLAGVGASVGHTMLDFLVPSQALGTSLGVRIDLGPTATPGSYTSETTAIWSAIAIRSVPVRGSCIFTAGSTSIPEGSFRVDLRSLDAMTAHGSLALTVFVLPSTSETGMQSDCGPGTTEDLEIQF